MLDAVNFGHDNMQMIIKAIDELIDEVGVSEQEAAQPEDNSDLYSSIKTSYAEKISSVYQIIEKQERYEKLSLLKDEVIKDQLNEEDDNSEKISKVFDNLKKDIVRERILSGEKRIDGNYFINILSHKDETFLLEDSKSLLKITPTSLSNFWSS